MRDTILKAVPILTEASNCCNPAERPDPNKVESYRSDGAGRVFKIDYPDVSMYELFRKRALLEPYECAAEFMGRRTTYGELLKKVDSFSASLCRLGLSKGDRVLICLPNCTQAAITMYAVNKCGGICEMIHPLSAKREVSEYVERSKAGIAVVMDLFADKFTDSLGKSDLRHMVIASVKDNLNAIGKLYFHMKAGRKLPKTDAEGIHRFKDLLACDPMPAADVRGCDPAVIMHTGGTGGKAKGVMLSNMNINANSIQALVSVGRIDRNYRKMLAAMPIFHGFGLCIGVHMIMIEGGDCIFVPRFTPDSYAKLIVKERPNYIAGVPTLFEHMMRSKHIRKADLSCLKGIFVGGDSLNESLRKRLETFLKERNCETPVREGYGLTECVTASCLTPADEHRPGSVGLPFADTEYMIAAVGTDDPVPPGSEGEICICGPSVMMGYIDNPGENEVMLRVHSDGKTWLHTGDMGSIDRDGFIYFKQRIKRIIISSGYNVYPGQIENILDSHPLVSCSCVIGVPDEVRKERVKAYVVLKDRGDIERAVEELRNYCYDNLAKYCVPKEFEVLDDMPRTLIGKIAFNVLQEYSIRGPGNRSG